MRLFCDAAVLHRWCARFWKKPSRNSAAPTQTSSQGRAAAQARRPCDWLWRHWRAQSTHCPLRTLPSSNPGCPWWTWWSPWRPLQTRPPWRRPLSWSGRIWRWAGTSATSSSVGAKIASTQIKTLSWLVYWEWNKTKTLQIKEKKN